MPTVTLKFTLPDEEAEFNAARQGQEARRVLWDIDQRCRSLVKYGEAGDEARRLAEEIREIIRDSRENLLD